ncbi:MAG TPA: sugar transferase [bacterium]|jgi:lipopolysaccharide/colanic/teichoic acid biosynthesis glycosyltransferase
MGITGKKLRQAQEPLTLRSNSAITTAAIRDNLIYADDINYWRNAIKPSHPPFWYYALKRAIDIFFAISFLFLGIPWILVCGLLMKREAPGPFFYKQERVGKDGKLLTAYKLRSMPVDAESNGPQLTPLEGDKRLGPVGKFIRKAKIDELPQFYNVLIGEISVVGPRPERPYFVERFSREHPLFPLRHLVKPGLTGLAQINEMDAFRMRHKLKYDLFYVRKHNLALDMKILWMTAMYCFRCLFTGFREVTGDSELAD